MPHKDPAARREYDRKYRAANREKVRDYQRKYAKNNKQKVLDSNAKYRAANSSKLNIAKRHSKRLNQFSQDANHDRYRKHNVLKAIARRAEVVSAMGGECAKCGYNDTSEHGIYAFEIDHIEPIQRAQRSRTGLVEAWDLIRNGKPIENLQLLCANCHRIKTFTVDLFLIGRRDSDENQMGFDFDD